MEQERILKKMKSSEDFQKLLAIEQQEIEYVFQSSVSTRSNSHNKVWVLRIR